MIGLYPQVKAQTEVSHRCFWKKLSPFPPLHHALLHAGTDSGWVFPRLLVPFSPFREPRFPKQCTAPTWEPELTARPQEPATRAREPPFEC